MKVECVYEFRNIYVMYVLCMYMLQQLRIKEIKNLKEKKEWYAYERVWNKKGKAEM